MTFYKTDLKIYHSNVSQDQVEAVLLTSENADEVVAWCDGFRVEEQHPFDANKTFVGINVPSPTGNFRVSEGYYLVRSSSGKFYCCGPSAFSHNFEPA